MTEDEKLVYLGSCWEAFMAGRGVTKDDAEAMMADLADVSGYYHVPDIGTPSEDLHNYSGRRAVFARILLLSSVTTAVQNRMRRQATESAMWADEN